MRNILLVAVTILFAVDFARSQSKSGDRRGENKDLGQETISPGRPNASIPTGTFLVSPVYINGSGNDSLFSLVAKSLDGPEHFELGSSKQVGALWAVAYSPVDKQLYAAAFAKRHAGFGPLGTGGIYRTDWASRKTVPWLDLQKLGVPTGPDNHEDLKVDADSTNTDAKLMSDVGKLSLGGMDISHDGRTLYVMNLYDKALYQIRVPGDTAVRPSRGDLVRYVLPDPGCPGGEAMPFAVTVYQDAVYVGLVCNAGKSQSADDLSASVYRLNKGTKDFTQVFTVPLNYVRGKAIIGLNVQSWFPWTDDFSKALHVKYPSTAARPQPILSSIAFDVAGNMILGFMDRFGHQSGTGQPEPNGKASYSGVAAGDFLRVSAYGPDKRNLRYRLETNATAGEVYSEGRGNRQGPEGGEFFYQDGFAFRDVRRNVRTIHEETGAGGLVVLPETGEVLVTAHEPTNSFNAGGVKSFFSADARTARGWLMYSDGQKGTFGKANGVGGLALISDRSEITVGDRVWIDKNADGIRNENEEPAPNILLELWDATGKIAETRTDSGGIYRFSSRDLGSSLKMNQGYEVKVRLDNHFKVTALEGTSDKTVDNNAVEIDGYAVAGFTTSVAGAAIAHLDFGLLKPGIGSENDEIQVELIAYPNPVLKDLRVKLKAKHDNAVLKMADVGGHQLLESTLQQKNGWYETVLEMARYTPGTYVITISEQEVIKSVQIVKQ